MPFCCCYVENWTFQSNNVVTVESRLFSFLRACCFYCCSFWMLWPVFMPCISLGCKSKIFSVLFWICICNWVCQWLCNFLLYVQLLWNVLVSNIWLWKGEKGKNEKIQKRHWFSKHPGNFSSQRCSELQPWGRSEIMAGVSMFVSL